jgi:hypothetical protein
MLLEHPREEVNGLHLPSGRVPCAGKEENTLVLNRAGTREKRAADAWSAAFVNGSSLVTLDFKLFYELSNKYVPMAMNGRTSMNNFGRHPFFLLPSPSPFP